MSLTRFSLAFALVLGGCATAPPATEPVPEPAPGTQPSPAPGTPAAPVQPAPVPVMNPTLPPVPHVTGPLAIKVIYPPAGQLIQSKDSNFIFGSVGNGDAALTINGTLSPVWPNGSFMAWLPNPPADNPVYQIVARTSTDSASLAHPVKLAAAQPTPATPAPPDTITPISPARWAELIGPAAYASDTERVVTGYALTGGIQRWFLLPNTLVKVVGTKGSDLYVRLDTTRTIRIAKSDVRFDSASTTTAPPRTVAKAFTVSNTDEWTDIVIPINARPAHLVEEGPNSMTLTLYATSGAERQISVRPPDTSYISSISSFASGPQMQYIITLPGPVYGYQSLWEDGKFTFRVRKPPAIDPAEPLKGLTITIDPGHPPIGATGPTGLWEPEATLAVGLKAEELLKAKGVNVVMTRTTMDPVDLNLRESISRRANAHAFVSIHLNAVPDGINPFRAQGTATYHYYLHSGPLAQAVQTASVPQLGLPDNGVKRENFAVVRGTWMPSILVEGAFIIMPDQEAALRTPEYQTRYAQGIVNGLEAYFRSLATSRQ
ncbi:MAG TPA: N-acetylmuramoyl-L-alanine amidase [Gemmatimonadaceae bacterium]